MPKRTDIRSILVIGSGPIVIGQACEFDYSGNQALRALRAEGYRTILVNSNPATIMTDVESADAVYIEPLTVEFLEKVIAKEKPDAVLPTMGGQTALNLTVQLAEKGVFAKYGVQILGADIAVIKKAENRQEFKECMLAAGIEVAKSATVHSLEEGRAALKQIPFPIILRPSFTLGGEGGGICHDMPKYERMLARGLELSPVNEVLVEESLIGWKEFELEVVRDKADNVIIVCAIENLDPMGVHTGDSITVAPAQTLTDGEYQKLRDLAIRIIREVGVETGGSNVQFAIDPKNGRVVVIEINPRVSRSSALASKATGFPIAKIAARLAVGYTLNELMNDVTRTTPASFEPTLDYVVVKIPRFDFEKFQNAAPYLNTSMKSVGEVMAIGRTFKEAFLKALASMESKHRWLTHTKFDKSEFGPAQRAELLGFLSHTHHKRIFYVASAIRQGVDLKEIEKITGVDYWFLHQLSEIIGMEMELRALGGKDKAFAFFRSHPAALARAKGFGFSDLWLADILKAPELEVRALRHELFIRPKYHAVDTCAAEFEAFTPYLYSSYANWNNSSSELEIEPAPAPQEKTVMILGGGPNRIGQGIEFDYCCVHGSLALQEIGHRVVMVNCNPETVSTDFDISNRLYFEPVTVEHVLEIAHIEKPKGAIVQFGGQTPLRIAAQIEAGGLKILGTSVDAIDMAEDRKRCEEIAKNYGIKTPASGTAHSVDEAIEIAKRIGLPLLVRPSYVLGGRAMRVVYREEGLRAFVNEALEVSEGQAIFLDRFLNDATEVDVDVLCDGEEVVIGGVMEHIEQAGVHSGDAYCSIPPFSLSPQMTQRIRQACRELAFAFHVHGLMNVQCAVQGNDIYLIEVNPRASRTVPFVAKAIGVPLAKIAAKLMAGAKLAEFNLPAALDEEMRLFHVKGPVFPFSRFDQTDTILGPEMRSTGEAMGRAPTFGGAFAKAMWATNVNIPHSGRIFLSVRNEDKPSLLLIVRELRKNGFTFSATAGTHEFLREHQIDSEKVKKILEGPGNCVEMIHAKKFALVINTTSDEKAVEDSYSIRRSALETHTPCLTTISAAFALLKALDATRKTSLDVYPL